MPDVSVVVPALNAAEWLPQSLGSVLAQTWPRTALEIILVDDGSSDNTTDVAEQLLSASGCSYTLLQNRVPRGPSCARNLGWRRAQAGWIQFLDADDVLDAEKIARQAPAARQSPPNTAAVFSRWGHLQQQADAWCPVDPQGVDPSLGLDPIRAVLSVENFMHLGSQLFRREWLERIGGFDERHQLIEDVDLELRLLMKGAAFEGVASDRPLYWYRRRPGSLSRTSVAAFFQGSLRNAQLAEEFWHTRGELSASRARFLSNHYFSCARVLAEHSPDLLEPLVQRIYRLTPDFEPPQPALRALTRLVGYRRAEQVAVRYRRIRRLLPFGRVPSPSPYAVSSTN